MERTPTLSLAAPAPWFKGWFDTTYYHQLYAGRNDDEAAGFIDTLVDRLRPARDARMLDLDCGAGRHARRLASRGFDVTGLGFIRRLTSMPRGMFGSHREHAAGHVLSSPATPRGDYARRRSRAAARAAPARRG